MNLEDRVADNNKNKITKGEKTKRKLFDCAAQLFKQYTFDEVSVDKIVEAAGVAKGTFYIYFESKDALIAAFMDDYVKRVDAYYRATVEAFPSNTPSSEILLVLISKIADTLVDNIGYNSMRTVYNIQLSATVDMDVIKGYNRELYNVFADLLSRGLQRGEFKTNITLDVLTRHFVMAIRGLSYEWCIRYPDFNLKQEALTHFQLLLSGIETNISKKMP